MSSQEQPSRNYAWSDAMEGYWGAEERDEEAFREAMQDYWNDPRRETGASEPTETGDE